MVALPDDALDRVSALLAQVLEAPPESQQDVLAAVCAQHPDCADAVRQGYASLQRLGLDRVAQSAGGAAPRPTNGDLPRTLGPFRLLEFLGAGGMGTVYRAEDLELKRQVALKLIRSEMIASERTRNRFQRESAALARLDHPGLCTAYRAGSTDGQPWIAMRFVRGTTLAQRIEARQQTGSHNQDHPARRGSSQGRRELQHLVQMFEKIARALAAAHAVGVVHRDIKPANIVLVGDDEPVVIDFGLVRLDDSDSHLTMSGDHVGTPAYMAPEQVESAQREVAATTDVYALGVTMFEALTQQSPYQAKSREELFACIVRGRRRRLRQVDRSLPADLDLVLEKALDLEPARRYASMVEFADDLRRFLAHEPLLAAPPSSWYRLRKLVRRYPGQVAAGAAVFATAVVGAVVALQFARREQAKVREFDLLSGVVLHEQAMAAEQELHPAWPHKIASMEAWLRDRVGPLLAMKPDVDRTLQALRARALPWTDADRDADRRAHPKFTEWQAEHSFVLSMERAQAIREGRQQLEEPALPPAIAERPAIELGTFAWERVAPYVDERRVHGDEAMGLVAARAAAAKARGTRQEPVMLRTLAWAFLVNGQDEEAVRAAQQAWDLADNDEAAAFFESTLQSIQTALAAPRARIAEATKQATDLAAELDQRRTFRFALPAHAMLFRALGGLSADLDRLAATGKADLERRLAWARQLQDASRAHPLARCSWAEARAAIAAADDVTASRRYAGCAIELREPEMIGLVPIGMNPVTKLWEFYDLRSAWDGATDASSIPIPSFEPDGSIRVGRTTGIVFVLLPGGTFQMGAQSRDPDGPNHDPGAEDDETPHDVPLEPFFLSRHEMTQAQWARLWPGDESQRWPSIYRVGDRYEGIGEILPSHPVENVSWEMAQQLVRCHGMQLPTEAQWEFGCRGGTRTPWFFGGNSEDLPRYANVCDRVANRHYPKWVEHGEFEDGYAGPAPVGTFLANPFGLFDVHGNVWEWCRDDYRSYEATSHRSGDGLGTGAPSVWHVTRGGCYRYPPGFSRCSIRLRDAPSVRGGTLGLRVARSLRPLE